MLAHYKLLIVLQMKKNTLFTIKTSVQRMVFILSIMFLLSVETACSHNKNSDGPITNMVEFCSGLKGFNLLGKFDVSWSNSGYVEKEFSLIQQLGFNFVRLPLDYRTYTKSGDWNAFTEYEMQKIDKAVAWGAKYNVHVCINQHRAPGFCVNSTTLPANQQLNLWVDTAAQNAFVRHWEYFAKRYKDIPPAQLSFNLVNEPTNVTESVYIGVMKKAIDAIHKITPDRLIFVDGLDYGRKLIPALKDVPNIAQSIHCYDPFGITHYKAEWVDGYADMPLPHWPMLQVSHYLYGTWKSDLKSALVIEGNFPKGTEVTVNVRQVSMESTLQIKAGTQVVLSKKFVCSADTGADFSKVVSTQWGYQNISNKNFSGVTNAESTTLSFENSAGDWMIINSISLKINDKVYIFYPADDYWGKKQARYKLDTDGNLKALDGSELLPFGLYRDNIAIAKANNIAFMVQEFGVYNKTPHTITIAFLTDLIKLLNENKVGYALWNFTGSFGILNSDRSDCTYEPYQTYKLDRLMLNALTKTSNTQVISMKNDGALAAFPCPATDFINISSAGFQGETVINITDITGKLLKSFSFEAAGFGIFRLDISGLKPNLYILSAINKGIGYTRKIVIQ